MEAVNKAHLRNSDYELLAPEESSRNVSDLPPRRKPRHGVIFFILHKPAITLTFLGGLVLGLACFAFTFWLSKQNYDCPTWSVGCHASHSAIWFYARLNEVQGFVSAVFAVAVAMMAYATFQLAETTLWPALAKRGFSLADIDHYTSTTRGSLQSVPIALWKAKGLQQFLILAIVAMVAILQLVQTVIVGRAYSLTSMPTQRFSNVTTGGGLGFAFSQTSPPGRLPGAVGEAVSFYTVWANGLASEPLPEQRNYVMDRANLSAVGNFSAFAVQVHLDIQCGPKPVNVTNGVDPEHPGLAFEVGVNISSDPFVYLQLQPMLMVWVDSTWQINKTAALTRVMFGAVNGGIEGGYWNSPTAGLSSNQFSGISSLSCDVVVNLVDSQLCTFDSPAECPSPNTTLSNLATLGAPYGSSQPWGISLWLGAVTDFFGVSVFGTQPMFQPGPIQQESHFALPVAFTSTAPAEQYSFNWTQANLTNFIEVGAGALGMTMMRHFPNTTYVLPSVLATTRMDPQRTWILILPIGLLLGSVVLAGIMSAWMHRSSNVMQVRLGTADNLIIRSQTNDLKGVVGEVRMAQNRFSGLRRMRVRYGTAAEGFEGLAREGNVNPLSGRES